MGRLFKWTNHVTVLLMIVLLEYFADTLNFFKTMRCQWMCAFSQDDSPVRLRVHKNRCDYSVSTMWY